MGANTVGCMITKVSSYIYVILRSRGAIMYRAPIHFGALCKSTYTLTTRPRQNGLGRQNVEFYVHRGAAAKMFHFSFTVITCFSHIFFFFLFPFFLFPFFFFSFSLFCRPLKVPPGANRPLCPPVGTPLQLYL